MTLPVPMGPRSYGISAGSNRPPRLLRSEARSETSESGGHLWPGSPPPIATDKVAEFHMRWDALATATEAQHPDADLATWLRHEARGLIDTNSDPDPDVATHRIEWVA